MADSLIQPFRRTLTVDPVIGPVGLTPVAVAVPAMTAQGVTSFEIYNPNPFHFWFAGWRGQASDMPVILEKGHYLAPGEKKVCRTQMPNFVAAVADYEIGYPITDAQGNFLFAGQRPRWVLTYGSGM